MESSRLAGMVSEHSVIAVVKDQVFTDLAGETVILNLNSGVYYSLTGVGVRVWELIQAPKTVAGIQDVILTEYEVDAQRCRHDLLVLLQDLAAHGLIEVKDETDLSRKGTYL